MFYGKSYNMRTLLESGVHYGHKKGYWNPKMARYIYGVKNKIHIIDLNQTINHLEHALSVLRDVASQNGRILFVSTKRQAYDVIEQSASKCSQYYVNHRWLGGTLTNWKTVSRSIRTLQQYEKVLSDESSVMTKKERLELERKRLKLDLVLRGIRNMGGMPDLVFIVGIRENIGALKEAKKLGIPVVAIVDTNCEPDDVDFVIPGNDDSTKAIKLYCDLVSEAVSQGVQHSLERRQERQPTRTRSNRKDQGTEVSGGHEEGDMRDSKSSSAPKGDRKRDDNRGRRTPSAKPAVVSGAVGDVDSKGKKVAAFKGAADVKGVDATKGALKKGDVKSSEAAKTSAKKEGEEKDQKTTHSGKKDAATKESASSKAEAKKPSTASATKAKVVEVKEGGAKAKKDDKKTQGAEKKADEKDNKKDAGKSTGKEAEAIKASKSISTAKSKGAEAEDVEESQKGKKNSKSSATPKAMASAKEKKIQVTKTKDEKKTTQSTKKGSKSEMSSNANTEKKSN